MINKNNLVVYKASAGSGKTFNLVLEYISLLIKNARAYRHILAVTFTNKATAEMKQRILSELNSIRIGENTQFFKSLCERNEDIAEGDIRKNASKALQNILHDYSYFNILTIDAFLQKVMRNLAKELGVGSNYNLIIDDKEIIKEAIERLIESTSNDRVLFDWYMDIVSKKMDDGKSLNVEKELLDFSGNLEKETFKKFEKQLKQIKKTTFNDFKKEGNKKIEEIRKELVGYGERFEKIISDNGLSIEDFSNGRTGVAGAMINISNDEKFNTKARVIDALDNPQKWFKKENQTPANLSFAENILMPFLNEVYQYYSLNVKIINTWNAVLPFIDNIALLKDIANHRDDILKEEHKFLLYNTSKLLSDIIRLDDNSDISFIYEKIGSQLKYIMIDEFQDTSYLNWEALRPLVLESIDSGNRSVIVGDVKQSIYRWRNGDWKILNEIDKGVTYSKTPTNPRHPEIKSLIDNYRTDGNIVCFNNILFSEGVDLLCNDIEGLKEEQINLIKGVFSDAKQNVREGVERKGEVRCRFVVGKNKDEYTPKTQLRLKEEIDYYLGKGYKRSDIAIIFRKNDQLSDTAEFLTQENCPIVSDLAFSFKYSKSIKIIIDALQYIANEKNTVSLFNIKRYIFEEDKVFEEDIKKLPDELSWLKNRDSLISKPLFELVVYIIKNLGLDKDENELSFITSFCDKLQEYSNGNTPDINSFLNYWEEELKDKKITISDDYDGIRLITIHKAKGLEFPIVIIPYANWKFNSDSDLWLERNQLEKTIPALYSKWSKLRNSLYIEEYQEESMQQYVDNINLLYVALTRPKHSLSIIGQLKEKKNEIDIDKLDDVSKLLYSVLKYKGLLETKEDIDNDKEIYYYQLSEELNLRENQNKEEENNKNIFKINPRQIQMQSGFKGAEIRYSQTKQADDYINALLEGNAEELSPRLKGIILHNILSNVIYQEDSSKALEMAIAKGEISTKDKKYFEIVINNMLSLDETKDWFSDKYRVMNEVDIITREKDIITTKRPDRLMIGKENEVLIVDYKFASTKNNLEYYFSQINDYNLLIREMGYKNIKSYLWFVNFEKSEFTSEIIEVK